MQDLKLGKYQKLAQSDSVPKFVTDEAGPGPDRIDQFGKGTNKSLI